MRTPTQLIKDNFPSRSKERKQLRKLWKECYPGTDWNIFLLIASIEQETNVSLHDLFL